MKVHSMVYPQDREYIRNKVLVNFNVEEITNDEGEVSYRYEQLRLEPYTDDETIELLVAQRKEELKPKELTPRQARLILLQYELLDDIEELIKTNKPISIWWEYSLDIQRNDERLLEFANIAGITSEQLDAMFLEGSKLWKS